MPSLKPNVSSLFFLYTLLFGLVLGSSASNPVAAAEDSVELFGRLPFVKDVQISPDGEYMAYFQEKEGRYLLVTRRLDGKGKPKVLDIPERNLHSFTWVGKDRIFVSLFTSKYVKSEKERFTLWRAGLYNVAENDMIWPFNGSTFNFNISGPQLINKLEHDPEHVLISYYFDQKIAIFKMRIKDGEWETMEAGRFNRIWRTDAKGKALWTYRNSEVEDDYVAYYRSNEEADLQPVWLQEEDKRIPFTNRNLELSPDGKSIYYLAFDADKKWIVKRAELDEQNTLVNAKKLFGLKGYDVDAFVYDYNSNLVNGVSYIKDYVSTYYFDKGMAQVQADLEATFPNASITITSHDQVKNRWIVEVSGAEYGIEYYFYDQKQASIALLASAYPKYKPQKGGAVKRFDYVTEDKVSIEAYLTLPHKTVAQSKTNKKPPLIVIPHGGPEARDSMSFDWQRQFFAYQGYAVFQPNFRGSAGYGEKFAESGYGEWGRKMQSDVNDGVQALIAKGLVDKDNICIVGSSYGGYAALVGATHHYDIYKCAISFGGLTFLEGLFDHTVRQKNGLGYWEKSIGSRFSQEELRQYSPLFSITDKASPMLIMHGEDDTIVPPYHAERMRKKLKNKGVRGNKVIIIDDADHWFTSSQTRKEFLEESLEFLNKHID